LRKIGGPGPEIAPRPVALEKLVKPGREVRHIVLAHRFIANLVQEPAQIPLKLRLALRCRPVIFGQSPPPDHVRQGLRRLNHRFHRLRSLGLQQVVGILPLRQKGKFQGVSRLQQRQRQIQRPVSRLDPRAVAIKTKGRFRRRFPQKCQLIFRQSRAKRRHRIGKSRPVQSNHIDVAFNRNDGSHLMGRPPRLVVIIKHRPLVE